MSIESDILAYKKKNRKSYWVDNENHLKNSRRYYRRKIVMSGSVAPLFSVVLDNHKVDVYSGRDGDFWYFDYKGRYYELDITAACKLRESTLTVADALDTLNSVLPDADPFVSIAYKKVKRELEHLEHYKHLVGALDNTRDMEKINEGKT